MQCKSDTIYPQKFVSFEMKHLPPRPGLVRPQSVRQQTGSMEGHLDEQECHRREGQWQAEEGVQCATLTPGAPDDSSAARWTLLYAHSYTNIPTHVYWHSNTYCTHIHNYCQSYSTNSHIIFIQISVATVGKTRVILDQTKMDPLEGNIMFRRSLWIIQLGMALVWS